MGLCKRGSGSQRKKTRNKKAENPKQSAQLIFAQLMFGKARWAKENNSFFGWREKGALNISSMKKEGGNIAD